MSAAPGSDGLGPPAFVPRLQILGAALLFSTGGAAIKACSLSAFQVASFRSAVAAAALALALPEGRRFWHPRSLAVGTAYGATMVLFVTANKLTTAANAIFLQSTAPLYVLLLGPRLLGERARRTDLALGAVLALGLLLFFAGAEPPSETAPDPVRGNVVAVASGVAWALTLLGLRWLGRLEVAGDRTAPGAIVAGNVIACACCLGPALSGSAGSPSDWLLVGYLGVFQIGLAYLWMTRGVRHVPAFETSLLLLLEPVLNSCWAWLVHGERPGGFALGGCAVILGATLLLALSRRGASWS